MRAYLTGVTTTSIWHHYEHGARTFCGHELPDGMKKNQQLAAADPHAVDEGGEGRPRRVGLARRAAGVGRADAATSIARPRCARAVRLRAEPASQRGLILVDTKYEIGRRPTATCASSTRSTRPDSSRYWYADDYQARFDRGEEPRGLDKEYVRHALAAGATAATARPRALRRGPLRGGPPLHPALRARHRPRFVPDFDEPLARIRKNLKF